MWVCVMVFEILPGEGSRFEIEQCNGGKYYFWLAGGWQFTTLLFDSVFALLYKFQNFPV